MINKRTLAASLKIQLGTSYPIPFKPETSLFIMERFAGYAE
jgi:hypothetical protein